MKRNQRSTDRWISLLVIAYLLLLQQTVTGSVLVQQMQLPTLCQKADRIFRGTIADVKPGTVKAGGGQLPTVTFRIHVKETVAGNHHAVVELTFVGELKKPGQRDGVQRINLLELPPLQVGKDYLLFSTRPSRAGLSTTIGLSQGCFLVEGNRGKEFAVNGVNNVGLGLDRIGPVGYQDLVNRIRAIRGQ